MAKARPHALELDNEAVDRLLCSVHGLPPTADAAESPVHVRLRYLQKIGFPASANAGRGKRALHGPEGILQLALAFELLAVGLTPKRAAATVVANWDKAMVALRAGWRAFGLTEIRQGGTGEERNAEVAKARLQLRFSAEGFDDGPLGAIVTPPAERDDDAIQGRARDPIVFETTEIVVDTYSIMTELHHGLTAELRLRDDDVRAALDAFIGTRAGRTKAQA